MSKVRIALSTPPVAMTVSEYLFQSCVKISAGMAGGVRPCGNGTGGRWCTGILVVRWYCADTGVLRSKIRRSESAETADIIFGFEGQYDVL